ncbi:Proteasome activator pa28 beta subunit [Fragilaria crotonensis]|nr:Proteasome activator pa28 beta subunit [Fragilaria crotonensis]
MTFKDHQSISRDEAEKIKSNAIAFLQSLELAYKVHFPLSKLSEVHQSFQMQNLIQQNPSVVAALGASQDAVSQALDDMSTMCDYIVLHFPQMEDGNNFGVTVQMTAIKQLQDTTEALVKSLDELSKYYSARADAMDKLLLSSQTATETQKEENDGKETKTTVTKETKKSSGQQEFHRLQAVYAIDTQYYALAKKAFRTVKSAYVANVDFLLKNQEKIEAPKGREGRSNFSSMY